MRCGAAKTLIDQQQRLAARVLTVRPGSPLGQEPLVGCGCVDNTLNMLFWGVERL